MRGRLIGVFVGICVAVVMLVSCAAAPSGDASPAAPESSTTQSPGTRSTGTAPAGAERFAGVCAGIAHCRVVADRDVDGDGERDKVAWVQRSKKLVVIRVWTADGERLHRSVDVSWWYGGGAWGGATRIDGRRGVELVIGSTMGAHTPGYTMLTYRRGSLRVLDSPRNEDHWYIDAAYSVLAGWWRSTPGDRVTMTYKDALRTRSDTFRGANTTYVWRDGHWAKARADKTSYRNLNRANRIAGWHVHGLAEWPGF